MTLPSSGPLSMSDIQGEFGGSNPIGMNEYYAGGGLVPSGTTGTYGAVPTSGQISIQNFYGTSNYIPVYIEELFSTYLYNGNGSTQTITNGINLSGNGGMTWIKNRSSSSNHALVDSDRGAYYLSSNTTSAQASVGVNLTTSGFSLTTGAFITNDTISTYTSWSFRKQPKFFDVVTFTQSSGSTTTFSHNLGSVPGCIILKPYSANSFWPVYHTGIGANAYLGLNNTTGSNSYSGAFSSLTSTSITVNNALLASAGDSCVAYIFAHNAGGFGLTGTDNVISCGSYTGNGSTSGPSITLGYEPQWILTKNATSSGWNWNMFDNMRGLPVGSGDLALQANLSNAESGALNWIDPTATGFNITSSNAQINESGSTILYIAIRRGPMKVPTDGTTVFNSVAQNAASNAVVSTGFPVDLVINFKRDGGGGAYWLDRLRGGTSTSTIALTSATTAAEYTNSSYGVGFANNTAIIDNFTLALLGAGPYVFWNFRRAPSFFDEVCYAGSGSFSQTVTHNLGVVPEICIAKTRNTSDVWRVFISAGGSNYSGYLNTTDPFFDLTYNPNTASYYAAGDLNTFFSSSNYVVYLFASCPGVSKIGKYTGNGSSQTISCGFAARFVLIKRTDSTGSWFVWDTARGMVAGTDPRLALNNTAAESNANWVYTDASGFQIVTTDSSVNASGGTYIYLAIA